jgi:hypothetical protein
MNASIWQLIAEKKSMERSRLEKQLDELKTRYQEVLERANYLERVSQEYHAQQSDMEGQERVDLSQLTARQYLVQLMNMKNALMVKQADLQVQMGRLRTQLQAMEMERLRMEKMGSLKAEQARLAAEKQLLREEDAENVALFNRVRNHYS